MIHPAEDRASTPKEATGEDSTTVGQQNGRIRHRQGPARARRGVPYSDARTTLSLLPNAAQGEWLADVRGAFRGDLLDAGAGNQPYRDWYAPMVDRIVAVDAARIEGLSALSFVDRLPFADHTFDTVLSSQVWEHVEDPGKAATEAFRVLRPGGRLIVTVPFLYPIHEAPYDFGRFTLYGLVSNLRRAGFEIERLDSQGGPLLLVAHFFVLAATQTVDAFGRVLRLRRPLSRVGPLRVIFAWPQQAAIAARYRLRGPRRGICLGANRVALGYLAVARKPE